MLDFPNINPVAIDLGIIKIRWYAISYICGIVLSWFLILKIIKFKNIKIRNKSISDLISNCIIGIILGGRLGYVIFYNLDYYSHNLLDIFMIWEGGMSFHGGVMGIIISSALFAKKYNYNFFIYTDLVALVAPIGIFFGRIANFINSELYGIITNVPWAVTFIQVDNLPRHPSQLYEALLELSLIHI